MYEQIVSTQNPRVKDWAKLLAKKGREEQRKFVLEGIHLVREAQAAGITLDTLLYSLERGIPKELVDEQGNERWIGVSEAVFNKCCDTKSPQAVLAIANMPHQDIESWYQSLSDELVVVIDGVQDPGNLGTIIRSAAAVGADGVILGERCADLYAPKTVRATMGAIFHIPIFQNIQSTQIVERAAEQGVPIFLAQANGESAMYDCNLRGRAWLVVGNEGAGISQVMTNLRGSRDIRIPMSGSTESLNVAMATTVLLYEAYRQRTSD
jgi:TrmH family RNA methyltransferase